MKNKKLKKKVIWLVFIFVIIIPLLINALYKIDSGICFLQTEWYAGDALSFYGNILGTAVTVLGVVWTINNDKEERKKDNSILFKPILKFVGVNIKPLPQVCVYREVGLGYSLSEPKNFNCNRSLDYFFEQQRQNNPKYKIFFQNVGRGETFNTKIDEFKVVNTTWKDISCINSNSSLNMYIGEIATNNYFYIQIDLPDYLIMPKTIENQQKFKLSTELSISYSDMFDRVRYQTILCFLYNITVEKEETDAPYIGDANYHYVKVRYQIEEISPIKKVLSEENKHV